MTGILAGRALAADLSSQTNEQLIARVQAAIAATPYAKTWNPGQFASGIAAAESRGEYSDIERAYLQLKIQLSANPEAVAAIEILLSRLKTTEDAVAAKRNEEVSAIMKDLSDKFAANAPAKDYDELLRRISEIEAAAAQNPTSNPRFVVGVQRIDDVRAFVAGWQDYLVATEQGNRQAASSSLSQLIQLTARFTLIPRSTLLNLQAPPGSKSKADAAEAERAKKFREHFVAVIDAAKAPSDLDGLLAEEVPAGTESPQAYATKTFVRAWQDYLAAAQAGKDAEAQKILVELAARSDSTVYPRSKILKRMGEPKTESASSRVLMDPDSLTLDNLRDLAAQIDALADSRYLSEHHEPSLRAAVGRLAGAVDEMKAGELRDAVFVSTYNGGMAGNPEQVGEYSGALTRLYQQVAIDALPGYIDIPSDLKPLPQERMAAYTKRVLRSAVEAKDWHLAFRVAQIRVQLGAQAGDPDTISADLQGIRSMVTAMNKEDASAWTEAVSGYIDALNSTSDVLPTKEIGARLKRIKAAHPEDYAKGESAPDYTSLLMRLIEARTEGPAQKPRAAPPGMPRPGMPGGFPGGAVPAGAFQPGQPNSSPASAN